MITQNEARRPSLVPAHWPWVLLTSTGEGDDQEFDGGYWEEPEKDHASRELYRQAARAALSVMMDAPG